jgi:hypothetical protein
VSFRIEQEKRPTTTATAKLSRPLAPSVGALCPLPRGSTNRSASNDSIGQADLFDFDSTPSCLSLKIGVPQPPTRGRVDRDGSLSFASTFLAASGPGAQSLLAREGLRVGEARAGADSPAFEPVASCSSSCQSNRIRPTPLAGTKNQLCSYSPFRSFMCWMLERSMLTPRPFNNCQQTDALRIPCHDGDA